MATAHFLTTDIVIHVLNDQKYHKSLMSNYFQHGIVLFSGNAVNAFSSDLNLICRNEVQTNRFEDVKSRGNVEIT